MNEKMSIEVVSFILYTHLTSICTSIKENMAGKAIPTEKYLFLTLELLRFQFQYTRIILVIINCISKLILNKLDRGSNPPTTK